jgi:glycosyltransferase involved in cell wall biosynthesis
MACGLPVVTTRVGGNPQVVASDALGHLVDWWQPEAFEAALADALQRDWDRGAIIDYARRNDWESRIDALQRVLVDAVARHARAPAAPMSDSSLQP